MKIESIDIFADIVDNYGDMGWVLEFLMMSRLPVFFGIVTDDVSAMGKFLERSDCTLPRYELVSKNEYKYHESSPLIILGLHAKVDLEKFVSGTSIIRVSYLTYDPWYRGSHEREHLLSTPERPIIELTYSPLLDTGGVWHYEKSPTTRNEWLRKIGLPTTLEEKIWIPIFAYGETLENLDTEDIPENTHIFFLGDIPSGPYIKGSTFFPWLPRDTFWDLIDLADTSMLRGEISSLRGLISGRPYVWDMYKGLGGWNQEDSHGFLDFISASDPYRALHERINTRKGWNITDMLSLRDSWKHIPHGEIPNFRKTLEKTIDKLGFSL